MSVPFFFYWYGDHRDLHSFPTRRSSDLRRARARGGGVPPGVWACGRLRAPDRARQDRKSTRLNSSHTVISYAVFCLKKKKKNEHGKRRAPHDERSGTGSAEAPEPQNRDN